MRVLVLGFCLVFLPLVVTGGASQGTSRALLIGIQTYAQLGNDWRNLDGPDNDIALVQRVLVNRLGFRKKYIGVLQDRDATRSAITNAFKQLIKDTQPGDRVYIHYSGYGSSVPDVNGDEGERGKDFTLVPENGWGKRPCQILDDEIAVWLDRLLDKTSEVVLVVDACHSGRSTRALQSLKVRGVSFSDKRNYTWSDSLKGPLTKARERDVTRTHFIRVSACRDDEEAHEYMGPDGRVYGLLTWAWCEALCRASDDATMGDLFRTVKARMFREKGRYQEPQFEGAPGQLVFTEGYPHGDVVHSDRLATMRVYGDEVTLGGGAYSGVTLGSMYERIGKFNLHAEVISVGPDQAVAKLVGPYAPYLGDLFKEFTRNTEIAPLLVKVEVDVEAGPKMKTQAMMLGEMMSEGRLRLATVSEAPDVVLALHDSKCLIQDGGEAPWGAGRIDPKLLEVSVSDEKGLRLLEHNLGRLAENEALLRIADAYQDSTVGVDVKMVELVHPSEPLARSALTCVGQPPSVLPCPDCYARRPLASGRRGDEPVQLGKGGLVSFWIQNRTVKPVYAYVVVVMPSGAAVSLPAPGKELWFVVSPLDSLALETASRRLDSPGLIETYLCFVTDQPLPLWHLNLEPLLTTTSVSASATVSPEVNDPLQALIDVAQSQGGPPVTLLAARRFSVLVGM